MQEDDTNKMANQFIALWQENFAKTMQDPQIMLELTKAMGLMQQFYGQTNFYQSAQSASNAAAASSESGADELHRQQLERRIRELEGKVEELERRAKPSSGGKRGKKKTS